MRLCVSWNLQCQMSHIYKQTKRSNLYSRVCRHFKSWLSMLYDNNLLNKTQFVFSEFVSANLSRCLVITFPKMQFQTVKRTQLQTKFVHYPINFQIKTLCNDSNSMTKMLLYQKKKTCDHCQFVLTSILKIIIYWIDLKNCIYFYSLFQ